MTQTRPLVSIGFPVYNGERFIRRALDSLLAQDFREFDLLISDNASDDATADICREYAAADPRIRYVRHEVNKGAPWNFEYVMRETRGTYFMWAAHDDLWHPGFVGRCVEELEAQPDAVACCTEINFIDANNAPSVEYAGYRNLSTLGMTRVQRFHHLICRMGWFAIYGLIRREAVQRLSFGISVSGPDVILLLELLMMGQIARVDEPLFSYRIVKSGKTVEDYQKDFRDDSLLRNPPYTSNAEYLLRTIHDPQWDLSQSEKTACTAVLIHTLACEAPPRPWRNAIVRELLGASTPLTDADFARLFGLALSRSVPLYELVKNPLLLAVCNLSGIQPDVLPLARSILISQGFDFDPLWEEKRREGLAAYCEGRFLDATTLFSDAIALKETSSGWFDWANAQLRMKNCAGAEQGLRRAHFLAPGDANIAAQLGIVLAQQGRAREAATWIESCLPAASGNLRATLDGILKGCYEAIEKNKYA